MSCPHCAVPLVMSERAGVEIDYCPTAAASGSNRGELDKIIERAAADPPSRPRLSPAGPPGTTIAQAPLYPQGHYDPRCDPCGHHDHGYRHHKRRKSRPEEIFD